jgi:soluble lytic murein transglycosylase
MPIRPLSSLALAVLLLAAPAHGALPAGADPPVAADPDRLLGEGWRLLDADRFDEALKIFGRVPAGHALADYALHFTALAHLGKGDLEGAERLIGTIEKEHPRSSLAPLLRHQTAYAAAVAGDLGRAAAVRPKQEVGEFNSRSRAEAAFIAARLAERDPGAGIPAHLGVLAAFPGTEPGERSQAALKEWADKGLLARHLSLGQHLELARALLKAEDLPFAWRIFNDAAAMAGDGAEAGGVIIEYADALRKRGSLTRARILLDKGRPRLPANLSAEADLILARIDWKAGRLPEARERFLKIAEKSRGTATEAKARHQAALLAEKEGNLSTALEEYARLASAADREIRDEARFRRALCLYGLGRHAEAGSAFLEAARSEGPDRSRSLYWAGRCLVQGGDRAKAREVLAGLARDPDAGPYAFLARELEGGRAFAVTADRDARSVDRDDRALLWQSLDGALSDAGQRRVLDRTRRLMELGITDYAIWEASFLPDQVLARITAPGIKGAAALFRYLAGDLRGGIRAAATLVKAGLRAEQVESILYPLAPSWMERAEKDVDPYLVHSIIRNESLFQTDALSRAGAVGLMQLIPSTGAETARRLGIKPFRRGDLLKPTLNVRLGSAFLSTLLKRYDGDLLRAVAAYNAGPKPVETWWKEAGGDQALFLEKIAYAETRAYVRRVFATLLRYYRIYQPDLFTRHFPPAEPVPAGVKG